MLCERGNWRFWVIWPLTCCQLAWWGWMMPKGWLGTCPTEMYIPAYWNVAKSNACDKLERWEGGKDIFLFFQADFEKGEGKDISRDWIHFKVWIQFDPFYLLPSCLPMITSCIWPTFPFDSDLYGDNMCSGIKSTVKLWDLEILYVWTFSGSPARDKVQ